MTYREALDLLAQRQETRIDLGLKRLSAHLKRMGDPQSAYPAVVVAGTNGKGSVCALLASTLRAAGHRAGLYTSPHLVSPVERLQVDGAAATPEEFGSLLGAVRDAETEPLTYFELLTAAAFEHFRRAKVDIAVLEVGLGGRLDATNCAGRPLLTIVTGIDFDHMDLLGDTLAKIAREKAGIFRAGVPALVAERKPEPLKALEAAANEKGAPLTHARDAFKVVEVRWEEGKQLLEGPYAKPFEVPLLGKAQAQNVALVHDALRILTSKGFPVSNSAEADGYKKTSWPGRFQIVTAPHLPFGHPLPLGEGRVRATPTFILDGAHNPQAMRVFCETFDASPWAKKEVTFIVGFLKDKDYPAMIEQLAPRLRTVIACAPPSPRALPAAELGELLAKAAPRAQVFTADTPEEAFAAVRTPAAAVCGSFYLVGAALREKVA